MKEKRGQSPEAASDGDEGHLQGFAAYLTHNRGYSEHTVRNYVSDVRQFLRYLGEREQALTAETADDYVIRGFLSTRFAQNRKASLARKLSALRCFYRFLLLEGKVASNPAALLAMPKREQMLPNFLSVDDVFRVLEAPGEDSFIRTRDRAMLEFLYRHVEQPVFQCRFRWEPNSIAFWDNRSVQHYAVWDYFPEVRSGWRVTLSGTKPFHDPDGVTGEPKRGFGQPAPRWTGPAARSAR